MSENSGTTRFLPDGVVAALKSVQQTCPTETVAYTRPLHVGPKIAAKCIYCCARRRCKYIEFRYVPLGS